MVPFGVWVGWVGDVLLVSSPEVFSLSFHSVVLTASISLWSVRENIRVSREVILGFFGWVGVWSVGPGLAAGVAAGVAAVPLLLTDRALVPCTTDAIGSSSERGSGVLGCDM